MAGQRALLGISLVMLAASGCDPIGSQHVAVKNLCPAEITANIVSIRAEEMADQSILQHLAQPIASTDTAEFLADFGNDGYVVVRGPGGTWTSVAPFRVDGERTSIDVSGDECPSPG